MISVLVIDKNLMIHKTPRKRSYTIGIDYISRFYTINKIKVYSRDTNLLLNRTHNSSFKIFKIQNMIKNNFNFYISEFQNECSRDPEKIFSRNIILNKQLLYSKMYSIKLFKNFNLTMYKHGVTHLTYDHYTVTYATFVE